MGERRQVAQRDEFFQRLDDPGQNRETPADAEQPLTHGFGEANIHLHRDELPHEEGGEEGDEDGGGEHGLDPASKARFCAG